jgi:hypothetical protein
MSEALRYLTSEDGTKTAVVLSIAEYEKLLEDLADLAVVAERRSEPTISHEQLKAEWRLAAYGQFLRNDPPEDAVYDSYR